MYAVNGSALYVEGFSYDGTGEDAQFFAGQSDRPGEEAVLLTISGGGEGGQQMVLEQLENRNLFLRYTKYCVRKITFCSFLRELRDSMYSYTVRKETKCRWETEILHELVHDAT